MNPCNKILNELYLGTINLPSQAGIIAALLFLDAFTHTDDIMASLKVGSIDIQQGRNTSSPWSKLKTGVSPLG